MDVNISRDMPEVEVYVASVDLSKEDETAPIGVSEFKQQARDKLNCSDGSVKDV